MKILQVNKFAYRKGGADRHCLDLIDLLTKAGHEVSLFSMRHPDNYVWPDDDLFVSQVNFENPKTFKEKIRAAGRMLYSFEAKRKFAQLLDRRRPDIIHVHNIYHQISPSILVEAAKWNIPVVMTLHDFKLLAPNYLLYHDGAICERTKADRYFKAVGHRCVKGSRLGSVLCALEMWLHRTLKLYTNTVSVFVSPSRFLADKVREYGIPTKRLEVIPNFIVPHPIPAQQDGEYALFFGRLSDEKGVDVLLEAWKQLPKIPLKIVGTGPDETKLRTKADWDLLANVEFTGYKSGAELDALIANARCIIVPSVWYENQPLTILEAFQFGKPVIASDIGAIPDLIERGVNGLLFKPGDSNDLADKVRALWNDPALRSTMSVNNLTKAGEFTPEKYLERILALYNQLIKSTRTTT